MEAKNKQQDVLLPHHEQQSLCTTRLPYRQGRKLTAVKVYTINNESNHLLIFGVPSLNLRQEAKTLFSKFGKLLQFNISKQHAAEVFTETYHATFEKIQSARMAKRMLDTKNFYGGSLHVCYAPELEDVKETRAKLFQRQKDVLFRLRNLQKDTKKVQDVVEKVIEETIVTNESKKINMGDMNIINLQNNSVKRKKEPVKAEKRFKPCFVANPQKYNQQDNKTKKNSMLTNNDFRLDNSNLEIIDCSSANLETVTNMNESWSEDHFEKLDPEPTNTSSPNDFLNYNNFGNEDVRKVPTKCVNKIVFSLSNKK